ncbi:hypothetical protein [Fibrella forsythiae]|uniref:Uncharacterized protein n=1 Tax=Fibrella forsythiae TaxID=2817061 RepID=A0ABS3JM27_9BACT|nr:hypothetical protein [Fibrella forsythiae]MBO0951049.1 hypothetical protein [Fibrella forsythiae]
MASSVCRQPASPLSGAVSVHRPTLSPSSMQPAVIIEQSEWEQFTARLAYLEKRDLERDRATAEDAVLTVRDVARQLHMSEEAVRRARRERRLTGFKID